MDEKTVIVYDWHLDVRAGGPTGYLANLKGAVDALGLTHLEFITTEKMTSPAVVLPRSVASNPELVQVFEDSSDYRDLFGLEFAQGMLDGLEAPETNRFSAGTEKAVLSSHAKFFHVHTTADCIKLHNLLTKAGRRHVSKIVLMSHTPEIPAREWANVAYAAYPNVQMAERIFDSFKLRDQLAFVFADAVIFPTPEATEPYVATWPTFLEDLKHKPMYFVATGATPLPPTTLENPKKSFGLEGKFVLSFLGRHNSVKGYDLLSRTGLTFLEENENAAVLIAGKPEPIEPPTHDRWIEIGWTDAPEDVIAASDVFVLPNRLTYFDLVFLEVLSTGKPILAANNGGNRSFAGQSSGIMLFEDEADLLDKLRELASLSPIERDRLEAENRLLFASRYTAEAFARRYAAKAQEIVSEFTPKPIGCLSDAGIGNVEVSVIVPIFNVEEHLAECIDSILGQTFDSFEVILVDDGSTDSCPAILSNYLQNSRIRIVRQNNLGLSEARNTGLLYAAGKYVCFVDSDDLLERDYLQRLYSQIKKDGTDLAFCAITIFDAKESNIHSTLHEEDRFFRGNPGALVPMTLEAACNMFPSAWNKMYRTDLFKDIRYPRGYLYEDNPVHYALMLQQAKISYVKQPLYRHRDDRPTRISRTSSFRMLEIGFIACLIYSLIRSETNETIAGEIGTRLLQRLFWERFWSVKTEEVNVALSAELLYLAGLFGTSDSAAFNHRDSRIEPEFLSNKRRFIHDKRQFAGNRLHLSPSDRMSLRDRSILDSGEYASNGTAVIQKDDGSILIHPAPDATSIAEISGLGHYGSIEVDLAFELEHSLAAPTEIRAMLLPERMIDSKKLKLAIQSKEHAENISKWITLHGIDRKIISLKGKGYGPCLTLYVASRPANGSTAFAWLHLRKIVVSRANRNR